MRLTPFVLTVALVGCFPVITGAPCVSDLNCPTGQVCTEEGTCTFGSPPTLPDAGDCPGCDGGRAACANLSRDPAESDVDCGGPCGPCVDGKHCGAPADCASGTCAGDVCTSLCAEGTPCGANPGAPCRAGRQTCTGGATSCIDGSAADDGLPCGAGQVCRAGACAACVTGTSCGGQSDPCRHGVQVCGSSPTCSNGAQQPAGTPCGAGQVCSPAGTCVGCAEGAGCVTNPGGPCVRGRVTCAGGAPSCVDDGAAADGTMCGVDRVCHSGTCIVCVAGSACASNPAGVCMTGISVCGASPGCADGNPRPGTACGSGQVCTAGGLCGACAAGQLCTTNPAAPCRSGFLDCASGVAVCVDGAPVPGGTGCGAGQVCNGSGACTACQPGLACAGNPSACRVGVGSCSTGSLTCIDGPPRPAGTGCGAGQQCDGNGFCGACTAGQTCAGNPSACRQGVTSCASGVTSCVDGAAKAPGTVCGVGQVCDSAGTCATCATGATCTTNPNPCFIGAVSCATGTALCVDASPRPAGSGCGAGQVCTSASACVACAANLACTTNPGVCKTGITSCATGASACLDFGDRAAGVSCGAGQVCNGAGSCVACGAGQACSSNPNAACFEGVTSCASGFSSCIDGTPRSPGTACGTNQVCNASGQCVACTVGLACSSNPNPCRGGLTSCASGVSVCVDATPKPPGTACGTDQVCNPGATCVACMSGQSCTGNPSPCRGGTIACATGAPVCADGPALSAGTACGANLVCDGTGGCGACTAGAACVGNPSPCRLGLTSCASGAATCLDGAMKAPGTTCGSNQVCDSAGLCVGCSAGLACTTNPGLCKTGSTSCATGAQQCLDQGNKAPGITCGTNQVCNGAGVCVACVVGAACGTNPGICKTGITSCGTGAQTCVDGTDKPAGTVCGSSTCTGTTLTPAPTCSAGMCVAGASSSCGAYACSGSQCAASCTTGAQCASTHYCNGTSCQQKLPIGDFCSTAGQCASGNCGAFYWDGDGDGYGRMLQYLVCHNGSAPPGLSSNAADCCDSDSRAHPGQTGYFDTPRTTCGGYDFDCSNGETTLFPGGGCVTDSSDCLEGGSAFCSGEGFAAATAPGCGVAASYKTCGTKAGCGGGVQCTGVTTSTVTQQCR